MEESKPVAMRDDNIAAAPRALRAGIVGAGFIGAVHARSARLAGARVAGVATSTPERSRAAAERLGAERAYATPEELATSDQIDVLHICTPNNVHADLAALALEYGKHVVCEKPLAIGAAQADRLVAAAAAAGRIAT